ncbi:ATP-binding cassette domain-containing protein [Romboutsia lituseburensis]|uniref:ABC-2 type transport system ATP-binding protein n=1 Tax=Romboutsia lituseburensis DSM 797 TaxID=1121325 RepID=A0A1G9J6Y6_9FIRM|nr:ATP-binding cassette domain-containing protein [Romboutsia lituseburensis]CEH33615.1 Bacitracin transport ATP-binding protein BcrA [Romboutsia lituseburensis]SDL33005.1 ABC-2 type transport system ATP-binding protein [Romboutsia lituseburensis DSM 797]
MKEVIKTYKLSKSYKNCNALIDVNINVNQGDIYGLVGNNGAGKTTLLKILTGQSQLSRGSFELFSKSSEKDLNLVRKRTGVIIETPSFYPKLTVFKNMEYYRLQRGIPGKEKIDKVLKEVGLYEAKKKKFEDLSLGMKQRLGLALAMMNEPDLLILDEPINGLDPSGIIEIRNLLLKLNKEKNITILISSHILTELSNIATCYGFLNKGRLVEELSAKDLEKKCQSFLEVKVTNSKKLAALLEQNLGYKEFKVISEDVIQVFDINRSPEEISELAISNKIGLMALDEKSIDLESYYMSLMGVAENA